MSTAENSIDSSSQLAEQQAWIARSLTEPAAAVLAIDNLDIAHVQAMHAAMVEKLGGEGALTIDLSAVQTVDAAGLQLLLAACQAANRQGQVIRFRGVTESMVNAVALLGLSAEVDLTGTAQ